MTRRLRSDPALAGLYYDEVLGFLRRAKAISLPEHTEDDEADPINATIAGFALLGHRHGIMIDHAAAETMLPTLRSRSAAIALAASHGYRLARPSPSVVPLVLELSTPPAIAATIAPAPAVFGGRGPDGEIEASVDAGISVDAHADGWRFATDPAGVASDDPTSVASAIGSSDLYVGHAETMIDGFDLEVEVEGTLGIRVDYNDEILVVRPNSVAARGSSISFDVAAACGVSEGETEVEITSRRTGVSEIVTATASGASMLATTTVLGQIVISEEPEDYDVRPVWTSPPNLEIVDVDVDGTDPGTHRVRISFSLPESTSRRWKRTEIAGAVAHWIRIRNLDPVSGDLGPLAAVSVLDGASVYLQVDAVQGVPEDVPIGTTDAGSAGQAFEIPDGYDFEVGDVTVDGSSYARFDYLLEAGSLDLAYAVRESVDGSRRVVFGDGTNGTIPPSGASVVASLRRGGARNGNAGAGSIRRIVSAATAIAAVTQPRTAVGWTALEASTDEDLDLLRERLPIFVRTPGQIVTGADAEDVALRWRSAAGSAPFARADAYENGAGPGTILLVLTGTGGSIPSVDDLAAFSAYVNGTASGLYREGGRTLFGAWIEVVGVSLRSTDVVVTINVDERFAAGAKGRAEAVLVASLNPLARRLDVSETGQIVDSAEWLWTPGGTFRLDVLRARLGLLVRGSLSFAFSTPSGDDLLEGRELPIAGATISATIVPVRP